MDISKYLEKLSTPTEAFGKVYLAYDISNLDITCVYKSESSGTRERTETIKNVECTGDGAILLGNSLGRSFRFDRIDDSSEIECGGKSYPVDSFLNNRLEITEQMVHEGIQLAVFYQDVRTNLDRYMGRFLAGKSPIWSGSLNLSFKFPKRQTNFDLKNVFQLDNEEYYLWGYSEVIQRFVFVPYSLIESKITIIGENGSKTKKTFIQHLVKS